MEYISKQIGLAGEDERDCWDLLFDFIFEGRVCYKDSWDSEEVKYCETVDEVWDNLIEDKYKMGIGE